MTTLPGKFRGRVPRTQSLRAAVAKITWTVMCVVMFPVRFRQEARKAQAARWLMILLAFWCGVLVQVGAGQ
jgi:hypothetical protein